MHFYEDVEPTEISPAFNSPDTCKPSRPFPSPLTSLLDPFFLGKINKKDNILCSEMIWREMSTNQIDVRRVRYLSTVPALQRNEPIKLTSVHLQCRNSRKVSYLVTSSRNGE